MGFWNFFKKKKQKPPKRPAKPEVNYNAGLALSGGGARGIAHIGAIRAFEENGIVFSCVAGTSAGSIVGALYAAGFNSLEIEKFARSIKERDLVNSHLFFIPSRSSNLENVMKNLIGDMEFCDLKVPFSAVAVDIISGDEVTLCEGSVAKAVSASSAVPGVFTPVEWQPWRLVDGGLSNTIPSDIARAMGADKVIAVDINSTRGTGTPSTKITEILKATFRVAMKSTALKGLLHSDIIITPDLTKFKSTKLDGFDQMLEIGYRAAMDKMEDIKRLLGIKKAQPATTAAVLPANAEPSVYTPYSAEWFEELEPQAEAGELPKEKKKKEKKKHGGKD